MLRASGRFIVMVATWPATSSRTSGAATGAPVAGRLAHSRSQPSSIAITRSMTSSAPPPIEMSRESRM